MKGVQICVMSCQNMYKFIKIVFARIQPSSPVYNFYFLNSDKIKVRTNGIPDRNTDYISRKISDRLGKHGKGTGAAGPQAGNLGWRNVAESNRLVYNCYYRHSGWVCFYTNRNVGEISVNSKIVLSDQNLHRWVRLYMYE